MIGKYRVLAPKKEVSTVEEGMILETMMELLKSTSSTLLENIDNFHPNNLFRDGFVTCDFVDNLRFR